MAQSTKNEKIVQMLNKIVDDRKDFVLKLIKEWKNELDITILDSLYLTMRQILDNKNKVLKKTDLSTWGIISPSFIKDEIENADKYFYVNQMFYLIYRWTNKGKLRYCNTNNATTDVILRKWLILAKEQKFFDGKFFNSTEYQKEYETFLKNWKELK